MLHLSKNDYKADAFILQKIKYPTGGSVIYQFEPNTFSNGAYSNNFKDFNYDNHIYEELALTTSGNQATFSANEGDTIFVLNTLSTPSLRLYKKYGVASVLVRSSFKNKVGDFKLSENHCKHHLTNLVLPASTQNEYELDYSSNILPGSVKVYRFGYATPTNNFRYAEGNRISKIAYFENNVPKNILETPNGEDLAEKVITIDYSDPEGVNSSSGKTRSNYESDPLLKSVGLLYDKVNFQIKGVGSRLLDYGIPHLGGWSRSISTDVKNSKTFDINNQILSEVNNEYVYKKYVNDTHPFSYGGLKPYIYTSTSTSKLYEGLDFKQTSTFMVLDTIYKQPMLTESTDALGKTIKTEYDYATIGDVIVNTQIRNYINGNQSETILNSYDLLANPMKAEFKTPQMGAYEILGAVNKYDGHGNLIHSITPDGLSTCFIWGYNKTRLVAKLVNISYEDFLANPNVQNIIIHINTHSNQAGLNYDEVLLKLYLDGLKFAAPNAMVTTYTYKPMVGISTITDENGKVTTYEYDTFNRLRRITDHEGNILKEYQYNFTN